MKLNIIYYLYELNGAYTSFEDLYYNLRRYLGCDIQWYVFYDTRSIIKRFDSYIALENNICYLPIKYGTMHYKITGDINIISSEVIDLINKDALDIISQQTYLFYPAFIYKLESNVDEFVQQQQYIKDNHVITICNEFNSHYVKDYFVWYMKFSEERITNLRALSTNVNDTLTSEEYFKNKKNLLNMKPFSYKTYQYFRYSKKSKDNPYTEFGADYYENIGKLMFEFLLLEKKAYYYCKNKHIDDGLTEFMQQFDIDDNYDYDLNTINNNVLFEKLFMKQNDEILKLFR